MPEGDTIRRAAERLRRALVGKTLIAAQAADQIADIGSLVGKTVSAVESRGKHLLIHFHDERVLHSHLGMKGKWRIARRCEQDQRSPSRDGIILENDAFCCRCDRPRTIELFSASQLAGHRYLSRLGPDFLPADTFDACEVLRRFRSYDTLPVGEALMNQAIVAGVGNVYKSELLFRCRLDPFAPVSTLDDQELVELVKLARRLLQRNVAGRQRRTRFRSDGQRFWVYRRSGEHCLVCGDHVLMRRQGDLARSTYWCPACQPPRQH